MIFGTSATEAAVHDTLWTAIHFFLFEQSYSLYISTIGRLYAACIGFSVMISVQDDARGRICMRDRLGVIYRWHIIRVAA